MSQDYRRLIGLLRFVSTVVIAGLVVWGPDPGHAQANAASSRSQHKGATGSACLQQIQAVKLVVLVGAAGNRSKPGNDSEASLQQLQNTLEQQLLTKGFQLVDAPQLGSVLSSQQKQLVLSGDLVAAVKLADQLGADYALTMAVGSRVKAITAVQTAMKTVRATFSTKLIDRRRAAIFSSSSVQGSKAGMDGESALLSLFEAKAPAIVERVVEDFCRAAAKWSVEQNAQVTAEKTDTAVPHGGSAAESKMVDGGQQGAGGTRNGENDGSSSRPTKLEDL